ncbi:uroporphyrinogen-III synthase [Croceiramulus getboli]|nr:uroporphyrinogen-III synthase [Flavobacteriaceae bacterium YJPT1-3]
MRILSTKILKENQRELILNAGAQLVSYEAIKIVPIPFSIPDDMQQVILTSQHAVRLFHDAYQKKAMPQKADLPIAVFSVGPKTTAIIQSLGYPVKHQAESAGELARWILKHEPKGSFTFFCSRIRRDELPDLLAEHHINLNQVPVYDAVAQEPKVTGHFDAVLFFSPSAVHAFAKSLPAGMEANPTKNTLACCIGPTTAAAAQDYFDAIAIAHSTSVESTIAKAINTLKKQTI